MKMQQEFLFPRHPCLHDHLFHILRHQHHRKTVPVCLHCLGIILLCLKDRSAHAARSVRTIRKKSPVEHFRYMLVSLIHQPFGIHDAAHRRTVFSQIKVRLVIGTADAGPHTFHGRLFRRFFRGKDLLCPGKACVVNIRYN